MKPSTACLLLATGLALLSSFCNGEGFCMNVDDCCVGSPTGASKGDPINCTIYYICIAEEAFVYECSVFGQPYYDVDRMRCDTEANVPACSEGTRPPDFPTTTTIAPPSTTTTSTTTTTTTTPRPDPGDGNCTEPGVYYVPYPGNCSLYMICANYELLPDVQQCPPGTLFDPTIGQCNLEDLVECAPVCPPSGVVLLPDERDCSRYWLCANGSPSHQTCAPGLVFDPVTLQCNLEDIVFCPNLCPVDGTINLPHASNCSRYWLCIWGTPTLQSCAPGLLFDPQLGQCNREDLVDCQGSNSTIISFEEKYPEDLDRTRPKEWNVWNLWHDMWNRDEEVQENNDWDDDFFKDEAQK